MALCGELALGIEVTGRRGRRRRKLLDDLKERSGYCNLKEEALDRPVWRAGFGPIVRQTAKQTNVVCNSEHRTVRNTYYFITGNM